MLNQEMHANIRGNVQGVGFRATTKAIAEQLHLTGYVENLPDGSVAICAQGPRKQLDRLIEELRKAFGESNMPQVSLSFHEIATPCANFQIRRLV
ncbi:MAG: acylphosphatase [Verrucomicrobia bacterium]|nr:acylphosphatase [Verrucomicrobiota bacterium]